MRPLFTIHAGEYLVASHIERNLKRANVWIPSRDTGIDLLVTDRRSRRAVSLQVKFSKDFLVTHMASVFQKELRACGWWTINQSKLRSSPADFWVMVLLGFGRRTADFIIIPTLLLRKRLQAMHGSQKIIQSFLWVTENECCWETRGLQRDQPLRILDDRFHDSDRNFTRWLNNWSPLNRVSR